MIVTFNRLEKLRKALGCFEQQEVVPVFLLIVDNHSTDGTIEYLQKWEKENGRFERRVLYLDANIGGSGGYYEGTRAVIHDDVDWIWLSDDDAYPRQDALSRLVRYYKDLDERTQDSIASLCCAVYYHGAIHTGHRNHLITTPLKVKFIESTISEYEESAFDIDIFSYVGVVIKREVLLQVGVCEKDYFIYRDDQEHSLRIKKAGRIVCVTDSIVDHDGAPFDDNAINWGKFYFKRNDYLMIRKHFSSRYFWMRILRRWLPDCSIFSKLPKELKKMYCAAYRDALRGKKGLHPVYRPGWTSRGKE